MTHTDEARTPDGAITVEGPLFRGLDVEYQFEPFSGEGARLWGGRFNRMGRPALYLAATLEGAMREMTQAGFLKPTTFVQFDARLTGLCDLTDPAIRSDLRVDYATLARDDWRELNDQGRTAPTQDLAETVRDLGFHGLVTPGFARDAIPSDRNVVLFDWTAGPALMLRDPDGRLRSGPA